MLLQRHDGDDDVLIVAVVGHTVAHCYSYDHMRSGLHPNPKDEECAQGLIRANDDLLAVCLDGGMVMGARAFLEIGSDGHFRKFERQLVSEHLLGDWMVTDLTNTKCTGQRQRAMPTQTMTDEI